jgi:hypothetical protein
MTPIHTSPVCVLTAKVTDHCAGRTVELFRSFPQAQHPREQRLIDLTLPSASFAALGAIFNSAAYSPHDRDAAEPVVVARSQP